jgi:hypothetical protein
VWTSTFEQTAKNHCSEEEHEEEVSQTFGQTDYMASFILLQGSTE